MMLIFRARGGDPVQIIGTIALAFEWRQKSRMRSTISDGPRAGESVGFDLPRGTVLRDGDLLEAESGATLRVRAAAEELLHVTAAGAIALARIAYHLGNRHVPVQVGDGWLRLQYDHVLEGMVRGLGGSIAQVDDSFDPEGGAYAGGAHAHGSGHAHGHEPVGGADSNADNVAAPAGRHTDASHSPRIHDFLTDPMTRAGP